MRKPAQQCWITLVCEEQWIALDYLQGLNDIKFMPKLKRLLGSDFEKENSKSHTRVGPGPVGRLSPAVQHPREGALI